MSAHLHTTMYIDQIAKKIYLKKMKEKKLE